MNEKSLALAAVGYSDGMRAFIHPDNYNVRVIGNEAEVDDILASNHSEIARKGKWEPGTLRAFCDKQSNLAAFEGQDGLVLGLCCQQPDDTLRLYCRDYKWRDVANFQRARHGTALAAVSSLAARKVVLFFQDKDDHVCCVRGTKQQMNWEWDSAVRLGDAAPGCGIAATSWKRDEGLDEIGLYYQDANRQTVELRLSFSECRPSSTASRQPIPLREATPEPVSMEVLAAVSWSSAPHVRVYLRDNGNIWEFRQLLPGTKRRWERKLITLSNISRHSSLAAVARTPRHSDDVVIDLFYWSASETLNHMMFVHGCWQRTESIGPPPAIRPPRNTDPYDLAFSGNAIRVEVLPSLIGVQDALWTLRHYVKWLKKSVQEVPSRGALVKLFACVDVSESTTKPPRYVGHLTNLGALVLRLSEPSGDNRNQDDLLQQCKVQATRVEVAIECWPDMSVALHNNMELATLDIEHVLAEIEALEVRLTDIDNVLSSTVARGKKKALEEGDKFESLLGAAFFSAKCDTLELDELRIVVELNSRNARELRTKSDASKTRARRVAQCFSGLLDHSRMLPLHGSAQSFAKAILDMLVDLDALDAPGVIETHVRALSDLRKQLQTIAG